jgi:uncharacterized membrane protein SpoIIM required for sporulation
VTPHDDFVAERKASWDELALLLDRWGAKRTFDGATISRIGVLYRDLCNDIVRCKAARFGPEIGAHLDVLAGRAHSRLYNTRPLRLPNAFEFVFGEFPRALRANWRFFFLSILLFMIPFALGLGLTLHSKQFAEHILPPSTLEMLTEAYQKGFDDGRDNSQNTMMAGFYVWNNVGIAFRCFATGIFCGLGSVFFLVYNGLSTGCVAGYVTASGAGANIWTFMSGHSPFEITAIFIAGAAGLEMGYALVATNGKTRIGSLQSHAKSIAAQIVGAAVFLCIAALIEGFWSPSGIPAPVKWAFAGAGISGVTAFLLLGGRGRRTA